MAVTGGSSFSAVSGSLSPLPVTVHTTVEPFWHPAVLDRT